MKSGKQRRLEIKARRRQRAMSSIKKNTFSCLGNVRPAGVVAADHSQLSHVNTYGFLPAFYVDLPFTCRICGVNETWTAARQKWWYEIAKGHIDSTAAHCRQCRRDIRAEKQRQKEHMKEMAQRKPHPNEAFFKST